MRRFTVALHRFRVALHRFRVALHHFTGALHRFTGAPHHFTGTLHHFRVALHHFRLTLHRIGLILHPITWTPESPTSADNAPGSDGGLRADRTGARTLGLVAGVLLGVGLLLAGGLLGRRLLQQPGSSDLDSARMPTEPLHLADAGHAASADTGGSAEGSMAPPNVPLPAAAPVPMGNPDDPSTEASSRGATRVNAGSGPVTSIEDATMPSVAQGASGAPRPPGSGNVPSGVGSGSVPTRAGSGTAPSGAETPRGEAASSVQNEAGRTKARPSQASPPSNAQPASTAETVAVGRSPASHLEPGGTEARGSRSGADPDARDRANPSPGSASPDDLLEAARARLAVGDTQKARQLLQQAILEAPERAELYALLGDTNARTGDHVAAIAAYRRCLALRPREPLATRVRGQLRELGGSRSETPTSSVRGRRLRRWPGAVPRS